MILLSLLFSFNCLAMEHHLVQESTTIPALWQELQKYRENAPDDAARTLYGKLFALVTCDASFVKDEYQKCIKIPLQNVSKTFFKTPEARDIYILEGVAWAREQLEGDRNDKDLMWITTFIPSSAHLALNRELPTNLQEQRLNNLEKIEHYYRSAGSHR